MTVWVLMLWIAGTKASHDAPPGFTALFADQATCSEFARKAVEHQPLTHWRCDPQEVFALNKGDENDR